MYECHSMTSSKTVERDTEECTCDVPSTDFSDFMMKLNILNVIFDLDII